MTPVGLNECRVPPIVYGVARAICESRGANPDRPPRGEVQSAWPMWMDHIGAARAALDRAAIMLRGQGTDECRAAAAFIVGELADV